MISETVEKKQLGSYWLSFVEQTGSIVSISKKKPTEVFDTHRVVNIQDNTEARKLARGEVSIKDYVVLWSVLSDSWDLSRKRSYIELQPVRRVLEQMPVSTTPHLDEIHMSVYKKDAKVIISMNRDRITSTHNLSKLNSIVYNEWNLMNIFVCKKNDPDSLLGIMEIDALFLMKHKKLIVDIPKEILKSVDVDDISFFTIPVFNQYGVSYYNDYIKTPDDQGHNKFINSNIRNDTGQINIYVVNENTLHLQLNLQDANFSTFDARNTFKFIVCDTEYDNLVGGFDIAVGDLLHETSLDVELPFNIPSNPLFLYKNNNITISYNGDLQ